MKTHHLVRNKTINIDPKKIDYLKLKALDSVEGKARLCLHKDFQDPLQEMIIVHIKDAYVRPHKHTKKDESISIIEGKCLLVIFNAAGRVTNRFFMGARNKKNNLVCRIGKNTWHSMVILSDFIVFHEVASGPFTGKKDSAFPEWAPCKDKEREVRRFIKDISGRNK